MIKKILKLLYQTNKKSFKGNSDHNLYPYVAGYNRIGCGTVWKNRKCRAQYKKWNIGPEKYNVRITDKGYEYVITALNIKIIKITIDPNSIFPIDEILFEGKHLPKDDYFNLALQVPMLLPEEFEKIRRFMERKDRRYCSIYMYMTRDWF